MNCHHKFNVMVPYLWSITLVVALVGTSALLANSKVDGPLIALTVSLSCVAVLFLHTYNFYMRSDQCAQSAELTPRYAAAAQTARKRLSDIQDGWISESDKAPTNAALKTAYDLSLRMSQMMLEHDLPIPDQAPALLPEKNGGIAFAWRTEKGHFGMDIEPDGTVGDFSAWNSETGSEFKGSLIRHEYAFMLAVALIADSEQ